MDQPSLRVPKSFDIDLFRTTMEEIRQLRKVDQSKITEATAGAVDGESFFNLETPYARPVDLDQIKVIAAELDMPDSLAVAMGVDPSRCADPDLRSLLTSLVSGARSILKIEEEYRNGS